MVTIWQKILSNLRTFVSNYTMFFFFSANQSWTGLRRGFNLWKMKMQMILNKISSITSYIAHLISSTKCMFTSVQTFLYSIQNGKRENDLNSTFRKQEGTKASNKRGKLKFCLVTCLPASPAFSASDCYFPLSDMNLGTHISSLSFQTPLHRPFPQTPQPPDAGGYLPLLCFQG